MADQQGRKRGIADIVFLIDATGSMAPCIEDLKKNIEAFIDFLTAGGPNNESPVKDWRGRVIGFRDVSADGSEAFQDNPFVRKADALKAQLAALRAEGGDDEPESLLDALYKVATTQASEKGQPEESTKWRYHSDAARVVVVSTDASFHERMVIPEAAGGSVEDVVNVCQNNRIVLSVFAPDLPQYANLSKIQRSEYFPIPGTDRQQALRDFTADQANFKETLKQLAASISASAVVVV